jgi:hypothetical protein
MPTEEANLNRTLEQQRRVGRASRIFVRLVVHVCGASMLAVGLWALLAPASFASWISFPPYNEHLIHDAGAFQIGIGAALLLSLLSSDALIAALGGFLVGGHCMSSTTRSIDTSAVTPATRGGSRRRCCWRPPRWEFISAAGRAARAASLRLIRQIPSPETMISGSTPAPRGQRAQSIRSALNR